MARKIKVSAGCLNIRLHPHDDKIYAGWLRKIFSRRVTGTVHGDRKGIISTLNRADLNRGILSGTITTFVQIDHGANWFDSDELSNASEDQISTIVIPRNLHPNSAAFLFEFDLVAHKLYFQTYSGGRTLTPNSALRLFGGFASDLEVMKEYDSAKITVVQSKSSLQTLFGLKKINEIVITIEKPNADIFDDDFEDKVEAHMNGAHSRELQIRYKADTGASLVPTAEIRKISQVACDNGRVDVLGRNARGAVHLSSASYPQILQDTYDPEEKSENQAFRDLLAARIQQRND